jgi:hypothetical protein
MQKLGDDPRWHTVASYENLYSEYGPEMGHYFRNLYRIFKFIDETHVKDKTSYSGIVRAQLSTFELGLLFYNGLTSRGAKFKVYAETYALFENLEHQRLGNWPYEVTYFERSAYGDQADFVLKNSISEGPN